MPPKKSSDPDSYWNTEAGMARRRDISEQAKAHWADPANLERMKATMRVTQNDPEHRALYGAQTREQWDDPEYRARQSVSRKAAWTDEQRRVSAADRVRGDTDGRLAKGRAALQTPEMRTSASATSRRNWADPEHGIRQRSGYTDDSRERIAAARAREWDGMSDEQRTGRLRRLHSKLQGGRYVSSLEARVINILNDLDVDYQVHKPVGSYVADLYIRSLNADVEVDGAYWHNGRVLSDATRDAWFTANGYRVIRVPEDADEAVIRGLIEGIG